MILTTRTGWIPDPKRPDDRHSESPEILSYFSAINRIQASALPKSVSLQQWFPAVYDQGQTNSCTANAIGGLIEYFEQRSAGRFVDPSRLFIYKTTRNLLKTEKTDVGAYLRTALEAVVLFGAPPESYWPFDTQLLKVEPPSFIYAFGSAYRAMKYYRYDVDGLPKTAVLERIKRNIAAGIPAAFGFFLFESISSSEKTGQIPFPGTSEKSLGGHAIVAMGYDDARVITNPKDGSQTTGALQIRNSWGSSWGDGGYGWLPYEYVLQELAIDWWSVLKAEWFDINNPLFSIPTETSTSKGDSK